MKSTILVTDLVKAENMAQTICLLLVQARADFRFQPVSSETGYAFKINILNHRTLRHFHIGKESVLIDSADTRETDVVWYGGNPNHAIDFILKVRNMLGSGYKISVQTDGDIITIGTNNDAVKPVEKTTIFHKMKSIFKTFALLLIFAATVTTPIAAQPTDNFVTSECLLALQVNEDTTVVDNVEFGAGSEAGVDYNICTFTFNHDIFLVRKDIGQMWHYTDYSRTLSYDSCRFDFKGQATRVVNVAHKTWYEFDFITREVRHYINGTLTRTFKRNEQSEWTAAVRK